METPAGRSTYEGDLDMHSIFNCVPLCVVIAMFFHANLNRSAGLFRRWWLGERNAVCATQ